MCRVVRCQNKRAESDVTVPRTQEKTRFLQGKGPTERDRRQRTGRSAGAQQIGCNRDACVPQREEIDVASDVVETQERESVHWDDIRGGDGPSRGRLRPAAPGSRPPFGWKERNGATHTRNRGRRRVRTLPSRELLPRKRRLGWTDGGGRRLRFGCRPQVTIDFGMAATLGRSDESACVGGRRGKPRFTCASATRVEGAGRCAELRPSGMNKAVIRPQGIKRTGTRQEFRYC